MDRQLLTWGRYTHPAFPAAKRVTDRFHVQKLAYEAVQEMRVKTRWMKSTQLLMQRLTMEKMYHAPVFANGDARKQLLRRSIYLFYKKESRGLSLKEGAAEIFSQVNIRYKESGYYLFMRLGLIYHQCKFKDYCF